MIGVGAEPGLTKGLYIERTNGKSGHVREVLLNDGIRKAC